MGMALRPRFEIELTCSSRDAIEHLCARLAASPIMVKRTRIPGGGRDSGPRDEEHVVLTVLAAEQHLWSPWLTVELSARGDATHVHAKFGPHPSVWTGFAFGYLTLGVVLAVSLVIAGSAALLPGGGQSWALWVAGGAGLVMACMWWASQIGQRLAQAQMEMLRRELDHAIDAVRARCDGRGVSRSATPS